MKASIEDFKTGWYGISLGIKKEQIDKMIRALEILKTSKDHFHLRSNYEGEGGVGDIEFYFIDNNESDNLVIDDSPTVEPNR